MLNRSFGVLFLFAASSITCWVSAGENKKLSDDEIKKLLVGKWAIEENEKGITIKGTNIYNKDGTLEAEATIDFGKNPPLKLTISGTWNVKNGYVIETVKKSSHPMFVKEGMVTKDQVISIDDTAYKFKTEKDEEKTQKRVKAKD